MAEQAASRPWRHKFAHIEREATGQKRLGTRPFKPYTGPTIRLVGNGTNIPKIPSRQLTKNKSRISRRPHNAQIT
jgi:hypothetical protein